MPQWHCIYWYLEMIPIAPKRENFVFIVTIVSWLIHECLLTNVLERRPLRRKEDRTTTKQWLRTFTDKLSISFRLKACFNGLWSIRITFILIWKSGFVFFFVTIPAPDLLSQQAIKKESETHKHKRSNGKMHNFLIFLKLQRNILLNQPTINPRSH